MKSPKPKKLFNSKWAGSHPPTNFGHKTQSGIEKELRFYSVTRATNKTESNILKNMPHCCLQLTLPVHTFLLSCPNKLNQYGVAKGLLYDWLT